MLLLVTQKHEWQGNILGQCISISHDRANNNSVCLTSTEMFNGTKSKFEAWTEYIENASQISGQNAIHIAFSKLTGSPLWAVHRLKTR